MAMKHLKRSRKRLCAIALTSVMALTTAASFGGLSASAEASSAKKFHTDFATLEEEQEAAKELNIEVASEGNVLLKNKGGMLPFENTVKKLSVFGTRSDNIQLGGSGSGGGSQAGSATVKQSLEAAGFKLNPKLENIYAGISDTLEVPVSVISPAQDSYKLYGDAAVIVISRTGSEFNDNKTHEVSGHTDKSEHYLELDPNEKALIKHVEENFEKIVVVINSASPMELGVLEDDAKIGGIVWVGHTGVNGIMALGKILNGEVNPSGRLSDIYPADFKEDPTWFNFGNNSHLQYDSRKQDSWVLNNQVRNAKYEDKVENGVVKFKNNYAIWSKGDSPRSIDYEEGIYMGYRWYETAAAEGFFAGQEANVPEDKGGDLYYNRTNGVIYPFGYGLSYTNFKWEFVGTPGGALTKDGKITVKVKVINEGPVAGKEVVQLYSTPEYYSGGIEKAAANLVDFQKTKLLKSGQSQTLTFEIKPQDLSSFDWNDANGNGFKGYELEAGNVRLSFRSDSHTEKLGADYTVAEGTVDGTDATKAATAGKTGFTYTTNVNTGNDVELLFSNGDIYDTSRTTDVTPDGALQFYKRTAFKEKKYPTAPTAADLKFSDDAIEKMYAQVCYNASDDTDEDYPLYEMAEDWVVENKDIPVKWTQVTDEYRKEHPKAEIQLYDMAGVSYDDEKWTTFMNQLTWSEMVNMVGAGSTRAIDAVGKPATNNADGPAQFSKGTFWTCLVVQASTFNTELCERVGQMVGNESLFLGILGWWGPGANIHRSPFSGRNFEYYSQDGIHGGKIAAAVIKGCVSKGVHVNIKHMFLNDQEANRDSFGGLNTWCNEQAIREIYIKPFELAIEAGCNGTMTAFNKIGMVTAPCNYNLMIKMIEDEFGFTGVSVTDMYADDCSYTWPADLMIRCNVYPLRSYNEKVYGRYVEGTWDASARDGQGGVKVPKSYEIKTVKADSKGITKVREASKELVESPTQYYALRTHAQKLLYMVANNNLMKNGHDLSAFKGDNTLVAPVGMSFTQSIAVKNIESTQIDYAVSGGKLPAGLTLGSNGQFSGKATEAGQFEFKVKLTVDNYVTSEQSFKLTVKSPFELSGSDLSKAVKGEALSTKITSEYVTSEVYTEGIVYSIDGSSDALPEGLTFDAEKCTISGTPTAAGTYNVVIKVAASYLNERGRKTTDNLYETCKIVVTDNEKPADDSFTVTLKLNYDGAKDLTVKTEGNLSAVAAPARAGYVFAGWFTDAECTKVADMNGTITADTTLYANWMAIEATAESGCNGSIGAGNALVIAGSLAAAAAVICGIKVAKRKED